jgi:hypothetical protein
VVDVVAFWIQSVQITLPPAAKVVAALILVYTITMGLKKIPALTAYLTGWVAIAVNLILAVGSIFMPPNGIQASNLWTTNTFLAVVNAVATALTTAAGAAGIHGTIKSMSAPQMLVTTPPETQPHEAAAVLEPKSLGDVALPHDSQGRITQNPN